MPKTNFYVSNLCIIQFGLFLSQATRFINPLISDSFSTAEVKSHTFSREVHKHVFTGVSAGNYLKSGF